jgi:hypothetical protein
MKCFRHPQTDAVGSCKHCFKGLCVECARDTGVGLVCSDSCEQEVKSIHALVERNKKMQAFAPKTHSRNAIYLAAMAVLFLGFGFFSEFKFVSAYLIAFGVVMFLGAGISVVNSRRIAKMAGQDRP